MPSGLFKGKTIKTRRGKLTRAQTAGQARRAILKKYGEIVDNAYYYHRGNGVWAKYSVHRDAKIVRPEFRPKAKGRRKHFGDSHKTKRGAV